MSKQWVITAWSAAIQRRVNELRLVPEDRVIKQEKLARLTAEAFAQRLNRQAFQHAEDWVGEYRYLEVGQHTLVEQQNSL